MSQNVPLKLRETLPVLVLNSEMACSGGRARSQYLRQTRAGLGLHACGTTILRDGAIMMVYSSNIPSVPS